MSEFQWTDEKVKMFTQIYSSNFQSKGLDGNIFSYRNYSGKNIDEKLIQFKEDCERLKFVENKFPVKQVVIVQLGRRPKHTKEDLKMFVEFLKAEGIVIEEESKNQDFDFLYGVWSGKNPDGLL